MTNQANNVKIAGWLGRCHVCTKTRPIKWCEFCRHWFCDECRYSPERVAAALKEFALGPVSECCGPLETQNNG